MSTRYPWVRLADEELLQWRIRDLGLTLEGTELEAHIAQLYAELGAKGLTFAPPCYLGDEWCVYENVPAIALPFYLAHPRLRRLESHIMLEIEGGTKTSCMRLLRHETGHAFMYAYRLGHRRRYKQLFGQSSDDYSKVYRPRPYSRSYVVHLESWYAQSHPDEDFAETFAVWLTPKSNWRKKYRTWKALQKLEYLDQLMQSLATETPRVHTDTRPGAVCTLQRRLATHYARKRKASEQEFPDFYDSDLRKLFPEIPDAPICEGAGRFMRRHQKDLTQAIAQWTGSRKYTIRELLASLIDRCTDLGLKVHADEASVKMQIASYSTSLVMNYLHTGQFKRTR